MIRNILVLGGTGFVGRSLCEALVDRSGGAGGRIIVPSRHPQRAGHLRTLPSVEILTADIHDEATLTRLVADVDAVVNLVAILHGSAAEFDKVHVTLPQKLAKACLATGVKRLIHISALGVSDSPESAPSHYLRSKTKGELALKHASHLDLTILRPSVIFGEHDRFINLFAKLQACLPMLALAGCSSQFQPVWVRDVASAIVHCLDHPETAGKTIECAGPEIMSLKEIVQWAGLWSGRPRPIVPLPLPIGFLQGLLMELLPGEPLMSRDNVASMRVPNTAGGRLPGLRDLGISPTAMASVMRDFIGHRSGPNRLLAWRKPPRT
jgi:uncharacterized protein YbjT (DUF2867 family)